MGDCIRLTTSNRSILIDEKMFDFSEKKEYVFEFGKAYALIGDFGFGGHLISSLMTNECNVIDERILVNSREDRDYFKNNGWRIGQSVYTKILKRERKIHDILIALKKNEKYDEIIRYFEIDDSLLPETISSMPHEKWRVSTAVGLLMNRTVFGLPYMNSRFLYDVFYSSGNLLSIEKIKEFGGLVIIPTNDKDLVSPIVDETVILDNSQFDGIKQYAKKQLERLGVKQ